MIEALSEAKKLWNSPEELIKFWETLESKSRHEQLVSKIVGKAESVIDLGCGVGRYARVLDCDHNYSGYDSSLPMIAEAKRLNPNYNFSVVDIFNYQVDLRSDVIISIDVVHHQNNPVDAIVRLLELWKANRYIISLLVGNIREELLNSTVEPFTELLRLCNKYAMNSIRIEQSDDNDFAWVLLEIMG